MALQGGSCKRLKRESDGRSSEDNDEAFDDLAGLPLAVELSCAFLIACPLQLPELLDTTGRDVPEVHSHEWYGVLSACVGPSLLSEPSSLVALGAP